MWCVKSSRSKRESSSISKATSRANSNSNINLSREAKAWHKKSLNCSFGLGISFKREFQVRQQEFIILLRLRFGFNQFLNAGVKAQPVFEYGFTANGEFYIAKVCFLIYP